MYWPACCIDYWPVVTSGSPTSVLTIVLNTKKKHTNTNGLNFDQVTRYPKSFHDLKPWFGWSEHLVATFGLSFSTENGCADCSFAHLSSLARWWNMFVLCSCYVSINHIHDDAQHTCVNSSPFTPSYSQGIWMWLKWETSYSKRNISTITTLSSILQLQIKVSTRDPH